MMISFEQSCTYISIS